MHADKPPLSTTSSTNYLIHTTLDQSPTLNFVQPSQNAPIDLVAPPTTEAPQPAKAYIIAIDSPKRKAHATIEDPTQEEAPTHEEVTIHDVTEEPIA